MLSLALVHVISGNQSLPNHGVLLQSDGMGSLDPPVREPLVKSEMPMNIWLAHLEEEMDAAAAAMEGELGEQSMCSVHRDGRVTGGLKYQEGRLTAVAEAIRVARGSSDIEAELVAQLQRWSDELDRRRAASPPSMAWVAYASGGVDASEDALRAFRAI